MEDPWSTDDCESAETSTEACKDPQDLLPVQERHAHASINTTSSSNKKSEDYAFRHQFNEKPTIILGCPGAAATGIAAAWMICVPLLLVRLAAARLRQTGLSARCPCCLGTQTGTGSWQRCYCLGDTDLCTPNAFSETVTLQSWHCCCPGHARKNKLSCQVLNV